ncbi:MAG: hypothetical protein ACYC6C_06180 [Coriobacteriia bacterium]
MDPLNVTIVLLLMAFVAFVSWVDRHNLAASWFDRARVRYGRQVPPGCHRIEGQIGIHFGQDDGTLILTIPLQLTGETRTTKYVGATDKRTKFTVEHADVSPDDLLAAYDESVGPMTIQVHEGGRIAEIGIARDVDGRVPRS